MRQFINIVGSRPTNPTAITLVVNPTPLVVPFSQSTGVKIYHMEVAVSDPANSASLSIIAANLSIQYLKADGTVLATRELPRDTDPPLGVILNAVTNLWTVSQPSPFFYFGPHDLVGGSQPTAIGILGSALVQNIAAIALNAQIQIKALYESEIHE